MYDVGDCLNIQTHAQNNSRKHQTDFWLWFSKFRYDVCLHLCIVFMKHCKYSIFGCLFYWIISNFTQKFLTQKFLSKQITLRQGLKTIHVTDGNREVTFQTFLYTKFCIEWHYQIIIFIIFLYIGQPSFNFIHVVDIWSVWVAENQFHS